MILLCKAQFVLVEKVYTAPETTTPYITLKNKTLTPRRLHSTLLETVDLASFPMELASRNPLSMLILDFQRIMTPCSAAISRGIP